MIAERLRESVSKSEKEFVDDYRRATIRWTRLAEREHEHWSRAQSGEEADCSSEDRRHSHIRNR
jgi:hypothetical protein